MSSTKSDPDNPRTDPANRNTPDSMSRADRANGEGDGTDEVADEDNDDPAVTGVQDGD